MAIPDDKVMDAFREFRETGDRQLRNQLIEQYRSLAVHLARRFVDRGEPLDDLVQVAQLGVLKAVQRFDPERGVSFVSFALPTVLGELRRHFRDTTWAVRVSRRAQELHLEVSSIIGTLTQDHGRSPTVGEIATRLGITEDEVLEALEVGAAYRAAPISTPSGDDDTSSGGVDASRLRHDDLILGGADTRVMVNRLMNTLPERERTIVYLRFFEELTQSEIADRVGISQMHVSRLLRQSFRFLSDQMRARDGELNQELVAALAPGSAGVEAEPDEPG